jgi:hypothetical protein
MPGYHHHSQSPDNDDMQPVVTVQIKSLQSENESLREQLKLLNHQYETLQTQIIERDQASDDQSSASSSASPPTKKKRKVPLYGLRPDPIKTAHGLIDGRSNAEAAFAQKCQLLANFKQKFGHVNVPEHPDDPKYATLGYFMQKQQRWYRMFKKGNLQYGAHITPERIQALEELGMEWNEETREEIWRGHFQKLKAFREQHGHTCVPAVVTSKESKKLTEEEEDLQQLRRWSIKQRSFLKVWLKKLEKANGNEAEIEAEAKTKTGAASEATLYRNENDEPSADQGDEEVDDASSSHNKSNNNTCAEHKRKRPEGEYCPIYWCEEFQLSLQSLNCDWLNSTEEVIGDRHVHVKKMKFYRKPNITTWYQKLEAFKAYVKEHGNGLVHPDTCQTKGMGNWVSEQRNLYNAVQSGVIESHPVYERNYGMLKQLGFVFDSEVLEREAGKIRKQKQERIEKEREEQSSQAILDEAKHRLTAAREAENLAKKQYEEAEKLAKKPYTEVSVC